MQSIAPHTMAVILFDDVMALDVTGPVDTMMAANEFWRHKKGLPKGTRFYDYKFVSAAADTIYTSSGMRIVADHTLEDVDPATFDSILVPGGYGIEAAAKNEALVKWIAKAHKASLRTISVCSGTWLLALAGVLDGKSCATHWRLCRALAKRFPAVSVDPDSLYVADGKIVSSAGVISGIDMTLALIEADMGRKIALDVARRLVVHFKRPGNQSQFSWPLKAQTAASDDKIGQCVAWVLENLNTHLSVEMVAARAGMSVRSFSRHFRDQIGDSPAKFIEQARLENARILIEENTGVTLAHTAAASGFSSTEHLSRAFERRFGIHPTTYRATFNLQ